MENHLNSGLYELYLNQIEQRKLKELEIENTNFWEEQIYLVGKKKFMECVVNIIKPSSMNPLRFVNSLSSDLGKQYLNELAEFNRTFFLENAEKFDTRTIATAMTHFENFEIGKNAKLQILQSFKVNKNVDCQP